MHASYFKAYLQKLLKLQLVDANDKDDLLGGESLTKRAGFFSSKPSTKNKQTTFTLGGRASVLEVSATTRLCYPFSPGSQSPLLSLSLQSP